MMDRNRQAASTRPSVRAVQSLGNGSGSGLAGGSDSSSSADAGSSQGRAAHPGCTVARRSGRSGCSGLAEAMDTTTTIVRPTASRTTAPNASLPVLTTTAWILSGPASDRQRRADRAVSAGDTPNPLGGDYHRRPPTASAWVSGFTRRADTACVSARPGPTAIPMSVGRGYPLAISNSSSTSSGSRLPLARRSSRVACCP